MMWTIFYVQNVLIILDWCLCDFLVLKHIYELHTLHLPWSYTDVDIFWCGKCSRISILLLFIYWCWLFVMCKMFLSFLIDFYVIFLYWKILMNCTHFIFTGYLLMLTYFGVKIMFQNFNIVFDYLLMLIIFHVQNVLIILYWWLCDFLVLKHMHQLHTYSYLGAFWDFFMHVLFLVFLFGSIVFSVNNVLTLGAFGCFSFVINVEYWIRFKWNKHRCMYVHLKNSF